MTEPRLDGSSSMKRRKAKRAMVFWGVMASLTFLVVAFGSFEDAFIPRWVHAVNLVAQVTWFMGARNRWKPAHVYLPAADEKVWITSPDYEGWGYLRGLNLEKADV